MVPKYNLRPFISSRLADDFDRALKIKRILFDGWRWRKDHFCVLLISGSARIFWLGDVEADCEHCCERFVGLVDLVTLFVVFVERWTIHLG